MSDDDKAGREATHTRTSTDCGPDFCEECSRAIEDWVKWPCAASQAHDYETDGTTKGVCTLCGRGPHGH